VSGRGGPQRRVLEGRVGSRLKMVGRRREARDFAGGCERLKRPEEGDVGETTPHRMRLSQGARKTRDRRCVSAGRPDQVGGAGALHEFDATFGAKPEAGDPGEASLIAEPGRKHFGAVVVTGTRAASCASPSAVF
jgi:hypothetical protein